MTSDQLDVDTLDQQPAFFRSLPDRVRWYLRFHLIGRSVRLWETANFLRGVSHPNRVTSSTQCVIEGFPRSANSYTVFAFQELQNGGVDLAHHNHVFASVKKATRRNIPTVVLIRQPSDVVASLLIRRPTLTPHGCLAAYFQYYRDVKRLDGPFLLVDASTVTQRMSGMIRQLNDAFNTDFNPGPMNDVQRQHVMDWIDERQEQSSEEPFRTLARPHPARERRKEEMKEHIRRLPRFEGARELYQDLRGDCQRMNC